MRRSSLLSIALVIAATVAVPTAASAATPAAPTSPVRMSGTTLDSLRGWARLDDHSPVPNPDETLTLRVDAHTDDPGEGRGHATIQHVFRTDGRWVGTVRVEVDVDCLTETEGGSTAIVTGTASSITVTTPQDGSQGSPFPSSWHPEVGFSFYRDGAGHRRVGWSGVPKGGPSGSPVATRCQTPSGTGPSLYLVQGGFHLS